MLKENRFRLAIRKKFLRAMVVRHWHRPLRETSPSLEVHKVRLDRAWSSHV